MLTNICEDCASDRCCNVTVIHKETITLVECGECYNYAGISSPSATNLLYTSIDVPGASPPLLLATGTEVPSYTNVAVLDALILSTMANQLFLMVFQTNTQPLIRQIAIDVFVNITRNAGANIDTITLSIYNFTAASWVSLASIALVTDSAPITKVSGNIFDNIGQYINLGFIFAKVSTNDPLTIINMNYAELCLTCCQDGEAGTTALAIKTVDYSSTAIPTNLEAIFTNHGIATTSSPAAFIANAGTQPFGPGNTHNSLGYNVDYSRIASRDLLFSGIDPVLPRFLFRMYCPNVPFLTNVNQIDIESWVAVRKVVVGALYSTFTLLLWNYSTALWEVMLVTDIVTVFAINPPPTLCRVEFKTNTPADYIQNGTFYCMGYINDLLELDYFYIRSYLRTGAVAPKLQYMTFGVNTALGFASPGVLFSEGSSLGVPMAGRGVITKMQIVTSIVNSNAFRILVNGLPAKTLTLESELTKIASVPDIFLEDGDIVQMEHVGIAISQVYVKLQITYEIGPSTFYG